MACDCVRCRQVCALVGIVGHLNGLPSVLELLLYASMGWMVAPFIPTLRQNIDPEGAPVLC